MKYATIRKTEATPYSAKTRAHAPASTEIRTRRNYRVHGFKPGPHLTDTSSVSTAPVLPARSPQLARVESWHSTLAQLTLIGPMLSNLSVQSNIAPKFEAEADRWKLETCGLSSISAMKAHPSYQAIISMGINVLPLILDELRRETANWFPALKAISGEDPVPPEVRGDMAGMTEAWLKWGRARGLLPENDPENLSESE